MTQTCAIILINLFSFESRKLAKTKEQEWKRKLCLLYKARHFPMTSSWLTVMPWLRGRLVATIACLWMGASFQKLNQEPVRHYVIITCLKNRNPKSNLGTWFLNFLTPENLSKIGQSFVCKLDLNPLPENTVYNFNNQKSYHKISNSKSIKLSSRQKIMATDSITMLGHQNSYTNSNDNIKTLRYNEWK